MRRPLACALAMAAAGMAASARADPRDPGPFAVRASTLRVGDAERPVEVLCPDDAAPHVVVEIAHDRGDDASAVMGLARHLASHGFIVLAPTMPARPVAFDQWLSSYGGLLWTVLTKFRDEVAAKDGRCVPQVRDGAHEVAIVGHGAGGVAAQSAVRLQDGYPTRDLAHVFLDSTDEPYWQARRKAGANIGIGSDGYAEDHPPHDLYLRGEPSRCNDDADDVAPDSVFERSTGIARTAARVRGAGHCDAVIPSSAACAARCGAASSARQSVFLRHVTAWLLAHAAGDARYRALLDDDAAIADVDRRGPSPPAARTYSGFNLSLLLGASVRSTGGDAAATRFLAGFRPEYTLPRRSAKQVGVGPYGEVHFGGGDLVLGAGATLVLPFFVAPSAGVYARRYDAWNAGISAGAFFGARQLNTISSFDACFGLRVDARWGLGDDRERALVIALQGDLTAVAALFAFAR